MIKKKRRLFILMLVYFICFTSFGVKAATKVIYQVDKNYPPYTFTSKNYLHGFDIDLINLIFDREKYDLNLSADNWSSVYSKLILGKVDIGGIAGITDSRKTEVLFSKPLFKAYSAVYTRHDYRKVDLNRLNEYRVGVGKNYFTEDILRDKLGVNNYIAYDNMEDAIKDLEDEKIDVIFENQQLMDYMLMHKNLKGVITPQITNLFPVEEAYAVSKDKPELVAYINIRIDQLKKSGVFEELYKKYFYSNSEEYHDNQHKSYLVLLGFAIVIIVIIFIFLKIYIDRLKSTVLKNYDELAVVNIELSETKTNLEKQYEQLYKNQIALKESEERYRLVLEASNDGVWDWDVENDIGYISKPWRELLGVQAEEIENYFEFLREIVYPEDRKSVLSSLEEYFMGKTNSYEVFFRLNLERDEFIWIQCKGRIFRNEDGSIVRMAGSISDITEKRNYQSKIFKMAYYDNLTNLPNRTYLNDKLDELIKNVTKKGGKAAVYFLDLDNFKNINDTLGHDYGDIVLKCASNELLSVLGEDYTVARFGGDEFIIIQHKLDKENELNDTAQKIIKIFDKPILINNQPFHVAASIGVAIIPEHGIESVEILKKADIAMYNAKEEGKGRFKIYDEEMSKKVQLESDFEKSIRKAIIQKEFYLNYQPYFHAISGELEGVEALIRWNHPKRGIIPPGEFIPLAEKTGLIKEIGDWVLMECCLQNKIWQDKGLKKIPVAVNVSEHQFQSPLFVERVNNVLKETNLDPKYLKIEITEGTVIKSFDNNISILNKLKQMGIGISLDDFGTGYSSLSYLIKLPLDVIKIDKSFVDDICRTENTKIIIEDIISMAHKLNLEVIAEGVETDDQLKYLQKHKCDKIQGYLFSKPISSTDIEKLL
ncbi:EAL domain-containing protein [Clostridium sp. YIM B02505]|uniref:EAL domain-containing protein n=1 Tax=Clostridium yunnanense TaxID=2800325 RepID=A0ABS1ELA2_9CLOT|nr:EAL domain-containing protein [Clostridium yunnanense]MBK1810115.1 EAL domain-containing protein [Clostridium yunnanense]